MKKEDYRAAIARRTEIRSELASLQEKLAKENREMNDDEKNDFAQLRAEDDNLCIQCKEYEIERSTEQSKIREERAKGVSGEVNFTRFLRAVASGRPIPADLQALRAQDGTIRIPYNRAD